MEDEELSSIPPSYSSVFNDQTDVDMELEHAPNGSHVVNGDVINTSTGVSTSDNTGQPAKTTNKLRSIFQRKKQNEKAVSLLSLFRYANGLDIFLMIVATLASCAHGCAQPLLFVVFGDMTTSFVKYSPIGNSTTLQEWQKEVLMDDMRLVAGKFAGIGAGVLLVGYFQVAFWLVAAHRQTYKIRLALFGAVLRQDVGWFDTHDSGGLSTRLTDDVNKIQEGIGDKMGAFLQWTATCISSLIIALVRGWKLALVILAFSPAIAVAGAVMMKILTSSTDKELTAYAKAGAIATEVFGAIRTVFVFNGQDKECARYERNLVNAKKSGIVKGMASGGGLGITYFVLYCSYCLAYWYGGKLVTSHEYLPGNMLIVFFGVVMASMALGNASPNFQSVSVARNAAYFIWDLVDRKPPIDSASEDGLRPDKLTGDIEFRNVAFHYPSRPEIQILQGLNLSIKNGQTVALVGGSGCGKSTVIQLLQRFYDPLEGTVLVDGNDVSQLNVKWLRQRIGVVSQEPVLFALSIADNIRYGRDGITDSDIEKAAREANAHDFISQLPQKYETLVGERGAQLSGGQKQRIAIARALVRDPKILLLDEATSALDTESEATVQAALDKARLGRTTIIVAHRLSTIKNADIIYGIKDGVVHECGTHEELMDREGIYHQLVTNQTKGNEEEDSTLEAVSLEEDISAPLHKQSVVDKTADDDDELAEEDPEVKEKLKEVGMFTLLRHNASEWHFILCGCISSIIHGGCHPIFAILFAEILKTFGERYVGDRDERIKFLALMYLVVGAGSGLSMFISSYMFAISGETLTMRMRSSVFRSLLGKDMSFFDNPKNSVGALTARLAADASAVQGATGIRLGMMLQALSTTAVGLIIGFIFSWKYALFIIGTFPFLMVAHVMQMRLAKGFSGKRGKHMEDAAKVASEGISNIRTIASLSRESKFVEEYARLTNPPFKYNLRVAHIYGIGFSFAQAMIFFCNAGIFYFGAWLIAYDGLSYDNMFKVFMAIVLAAVYIGRESQFAPDYGKAKLAAARVFAVVKHHALIDNYSTEGAQPKTCDGKVKFEGAEFSYPNRATVKVLDGINLSVERGKTVALVGSSGCGKSTTIQLLERLYDVSAGHVKLDGVDVRDLNVSWLRNQLGLVSQEPILFDYSIRENIAYGDNSRLVTMDEIIAAARLANIHQFIESLPEGYETRVGDKGTQLSGGQKQRIAIARALVRNPKILLLDEATSALDTESEKVVQEALDRAQEGRTCLVIAHRLSTIQNADCIIVFHNGRVTEQGTHSELLASRGMYYKLQQAQARKK